MAKQAIASQQTTVAQQHLASLAAAPIEQVSGSQTVNTQESVVPSMTGYAADMNGLAQSGRPTGSDAPNAAAGPDATPVITTAPQPIPDRETAWANILRDKRVANDIATQGYALLSAKQSRAITNGPDARLLFKQDTADDRPECLKKARLSLWPTDNGIVALVQGADVYLSLCPKRIAQVVKKARYIHDKATATLDSLPIASISSEHDLMLAITNARILSLVHNARHGVVVQAGGGRHRLPKGQAFHATLNTDQGPASFVSTGVQFEIDALHESHDMITVAEAKLLQADEGWDTFETLHLRQLVFPTHWIAERMRQQGSTKKLETAVVLARPTGNADGHWTVVWLPVLLHTASGVLAAEVNWTRAQAFTIIQTETHRSEPPPAVDLKKLPRPRPTGKHTTTFPQWDNWSVVDSVAWVLGNEGYAAISHKLSAFEQQQLRVGDWTSVKRILNQGAKTDVCFETIFAGLRCEHSWVPRQRAYLVQALQWLGLAEGWDAGMETLRPTWLAIALSKADNDVRIQILWNIVRSDPVAKAILAGATFETIPEATLLAAGFTGRNSTAKRRMQSIRSWIDTFHDTFRCHPDAGWAGYAPTAIAA